MKEGLSENFLAVTAAVAVELTNAKQYGRYHDVVGGWRALTGEPCEKMSADDGAAVSDDDKQRHPAKIAGQQTMGRFVLVNNCSISNELIQRR
jgi:hypothetical protein